MPYVQVFQTSLRYNVHGVRCVNVWHYGANTYIGGGTDEDDLNQFVNSGIKTAFKAAASSAMRLDCVSTVRVAGGMQMPRSFFFSPSDVGAKSLPVLPANAVVSGTEYTETYNKTGRGRHFLSGISAAEETDNCLQPAPFMLWTSVFNEIAAHPGPLSGGGDYDRILLSGNPAAPTEINKVIPHPQIRKLRRRTERIC